MKRPTVSGISIAPHALIFLGTPFAALGKVSLSLVPEEGARNALHSYVVEQALKAAPTARMIFISSRANFAGVFSRQISLAGAPLDGVQFLKSPESVEAASKVRFKELLISSPSVRLVAVAIQGLPLPSVLTPFLQKLDRAARCFDVSFVLSICEPLPGKLISKARAVSAMPSVGAVVSAQRNARGDGWQLIFSKTFAGHDTPERHFDVRGFDTAYGVCAQLRWRE